MIVDEKLDSDYLAMAELTKEIGLIVSDSFDKGQADLSSSDIEHILKITSDVTCKIKLQLREITMRTPVMTDMSQFTK
jgi:hypothetical protein